MSIWDSISTCCSCHSPNLSQFIEIWCTGSFTEQLASLPAWARKMLPSFHASFSPKRMMDMINLGPLMSPPQRCLMVQTLSCSSHLSPSLTPSILLHPSSASTSLSLCHVSHVCLTLRLSSLSCLCFLNPFFPELASSVLILLLSLLVLHVIQLNGPATNLLSWYQGPSEILKSKVP